MSLQPEIDYTVPEHTARVARAAFPNGTRCLHIYDQLGTVFRDHDFADLFPQRGPPAQAPFRLALVTVLQFAEGLADRAAADAVRARIEWKCLLCLELDDPGFDCSVLCESRARLLAGGAERRLLDHLLNQLRSRKLVKARGRQRTDSTHVLAAIRAINRLECVVETLRHALNVLATAVPDFLREIALAEWVERYERRAGDYRLPRSEKEREADAEVVGADGHRLLDALHAASSPAWLRELPAVETLRRGWIQNFLLNDGKVQWRGVELYGPARVDQKWPARAGEGFEAGRFEIDWEQKRARCPAAEWRSSWWRAIDRGDNEVIKIKFARKDCAPCGMRPQCTTAPGLRRTITMRPRAQHEALLQARERQKTEEFKAQYARRAGVEGAISQGVRGFGLRRSRYLGQAKTRLQHLLIGAAINVVRKGIELTPSKRQRILNDYFKPRRMLEIHHLFRRVAKGLAWAMAWIYLDFFNEPSRESQKPYSKAQLEKLTAPIIEEARMSLKRLV